MEMAPRWLWYQNIWVFTDTHIQFSHMARIPLDWTPGHLIGFILPVSMIIPASSPWLPYTHMSAELSNYFIRIFHAVSSTEKLCVSKESTLQMRYYNINLQV